MALLLRFRDFNADTIEEHVKIISRAGYTWWGWWKKSDEPDRTREFEHLKLRLATGGVEIGLFDRSKGRFYKAYVTDCIFAQNSTVISSPLARATPSYYRKEKLPGWLRITRVDPLATSDPEYGRLFTSVPVGNETFFATERENVSAVQDETRADLLPARIRVNGNHILHLSDIHFGEYAFPAGPGPGQYPLDMIILEDLRRLDVEVGILVFSGDFTTRADAGRFFSEVVPFLRKLAADLKLSEEEVVLLTRAEVSRRCVSRQHIVCLARERMTAPAKAISEVCAVWPE